MNFQIRLGDPSKQEIIQGGCLRACYSRSQGKGKSVFVSLEGPAPGLKKSPATKSMRLLRVVRAGSSAQTSSARFTTCHRQLLLGDMPL